MTLAQAPEIAKPASAVVSPSYDPPQVEIVIPVFNEVGALEPSIRRLHDYLTTRFPFSARITIADNGSTDGTWEIAARLAAELGSVRATRLDVKGRGRALDAVWRSSD